MDMCEDVTWSQNALYQWLLRHIMTQFTTMVSNDNPLPFDIKCTGNVDALCRYELRLLPGASLMAGALAANATALHRYLNDQQCLS